MARSFSIFLILPACYGTQLVTFDGTPSTTHTFVELNDPVMGGQSTGTWTVNSSVGLFDGAVVDVPSLGHLLGRGDLRYSHNLRWKLSQGGNASLGIGSDCVLTKTMLKAQPETCISFPPMETTFSISAIKHVNILERTASVQVAATTLWAASAGGIILRKIMAMGGGRGRYASTRMASSGVSSVAFVALLAFLPQTVLGSLASCEALCVGVHTFVRQL